MSSLREVVARAMDYFKESSKEDSKEGSGWLILYKTGRSWHSFEFHSKFGMVDSEFTEIFTSIVAKDENAVAICGSSFENRNLKYGMLLAKIVYESDLKNTCLLSWYLSDDCLASESSTVGTEEINEEAKQNRRLVACASSVSVLSNESRHLYKTIKGGQATEILLEARKGRKPPWLKTASRTKTTANRNVRG